MARSVRVLIVDDSVHDRRALLNVFNDEPNVDIIGFADDGERALRVTNAMRPDLILLDLEMPRMDGFTFLRILMAQMPTPVVIVSSHDRRSDVFQALELGALDFVAKPKRASADATEAFRRELKAKVLGLRALEVSLPRYKAAVEAALIKRPAAQAERISQVICIGASTGGPPALQAICRTLNPATSSAYLVAQHMPESFTRAFAERLNRMANVTVQEAYDGMPLQPGCVYIAPGGAHFEIDGSVEAQPTARITQTSPNDRYSPSVDRLFISAAAQFGNRVVAIVLTGMGDDGSQGVKAVHAAGGRVIAESADTATVFGMPKEAIATGCVHEVLPLDGIVRLLQG